MADIAKYQIISADGKELNGIITIEEVGFSKRAVAFFQETTPNGVLVDINYTSENNISLLPIELADIAMIEVNSQLNGYGITGNLTYKLIEPESELIPETGEEEVPVYIVRSSIPTNGPRGQIYFEFREDEGERSMSCYGELDRNTYPQQLKSDPGAEFYFPIVTENSQTSFDYETLGNLVLEGMNTIISESVLEEEFGLLSIVETETEPPQNFYNYTIVGTVRDSVSKKGLGNVYITDDVKSVGLVGSNINSESTGDFTLLGEYKKDSIFKLTFSLDGYQEKTITPFTKFQNTNILQNDVKIILLNPQTVGKEEIINEMSTPKSQIAAVQAAEKSQDPSGFMTDALLQKLIYQLKITLIPFVLTELKKFGISKAQEALEKGIDSINTVCPSNLEDLNKIIAAKNKLTKQLNNLFNSLNTIKVGVEFLDKVITVADVVGKSLSALVLAFPSIPFSPDFTKAISDKVPTPKGLKSVLEVINDTLSKLKIASSATLLVLSIIIELLQKVLSYLALLDQLLQKCAIDGALPQETLSSDLLLSTQEQSNQGSPVITNVNGFEMGVISTESTTEDQLKRRQAVARNADGVIMLRGEPSFSSNDQILIDELIFYIKQNNLKSGASNETIINP